MADKTINDFTSASSLADANISEWEVSGNSRKATLAVVREGVTGATVKQEAKSSDIASASTADLATATGGFAHITGTTTITAFGTLAAGTQRVLTFDGALTLTHNATSLILPTGANITTAAGDTAIFRSEGSGNWRCVAYSRASGAALAGASGTWTHPEIAPPLAAWFGTTGNSPTLTDYTDYGLGVTGAAGGTTVRYAVKSGLGASNTTIITRVISNNVDSNTSAGVVIRDSSSSKLLTIGLNYVSGATKVEAVRWSNATTAVTNAYSTAWFFVPTWLKIDYNGTTKAVSLAISYDGKVWHTVMTGETYVTAPDQIGVYCWSTTTSGTGGVPAGIFTYWNDGTNNGTPLVLLKQ